MSREIEENLLAKCLETNDVQTAYTIFAKGSLKYLAALVIDILNDIYDELRIIELEGRKLATLLKSKNVVGCCDVTNIYLGGI